MALKRREVDFKGSLAEAIIPSSGTQPSACLRRDGALPCKVVITSTHALLRHPSGFPTVKSLKTLNTQWSTRVHSERCGCTRKPYDAKAEEETYWSYKYPWNLALGYIGLRRSDSNQHQCVQLLQNAPKHRYSMSLDPTPNFWLNKRNKHTQGLVLVKVRTKIKGMTETRGSEVRG